MYNCFRFGGPRFISYFALLIKGNSAPFKGILQTLQLWFTDNFHIPLVLVFQDTSATVEMDLVARIDTTADGKLDFKLYRYTPSLPGAIVTTVVFGILSCLHIWRFSRARAWYFIPFTVGGVCKSP